MLTILYIVNKICLYYVQNEIGPRRRPVFVRDVQVPAPTIDYIYYYYLFMYIDYSRWTGDRDSVVQNNTLHSKTMHFKLFVLVGSRYQNNAALSSVATRQTEPQNKATPMRTTRPPRSDLILNKVQVLNHSYKLLPIPLLQRKNFQEHLQ